MYYYMTMELYQQKDIIPFYIFFTVHLGIFLVNNQLDALFSMCLFHFSKCFEQPSVHHQENQLYQYIIWYNSHYEGDCLVCRTAIPDSHLHRVTYTR